MGSRRVDIEMRVLRHLAINKHLGEKVMERTSEKKFQECSVGRTYSRFFCGDSLLHQSHGKIVLYNCLVLIKNLEIISHIF